MIPVDPSTDGRGPRLPAGLVAALFAGCLALVLFWAARTDPSSLREQLKVLQFWSLEICVALVALSAWSFARTELGPVDRRGAAWLALATVTAFALAAFVAPRTSRIYYDEQIYQGVGQNLADLRLAQMCNDGNVEYGRLQCYSGEYNKQPYAYPHLLSIAYRLFGVRPATAFVLNNVVMALSVAAVYLLALWLFADSFAAITAGLLLAMMPQQILWSATAAVEPSSALACTVAVIAAIWFRRTRRTAALVAVAVTTAYAVQFRAESLLVVPVVGVVALGMPGRTVEAPRMVGRAAGRGAARGARRPPVRGPQRGVGNHGLAAVPPLFAINLPVNGRFYLGDIRFPVVVTLLAALGLRRHTVPAGAPGAGGVVRAVFRGVPSVLRRQLRLWRRRTLLPDDLSATRHPRRIGCVTGRPLDRPMGRGAGRAPAGDGGPRAELSHLPSCSSRDDGGGVGGACRRALCGIGRARAAGNKYVLTHNPGMFHIRGVNAGQMSRMAGDPGYALAVAARYSQGVYLHWNFWCNVQDAVQQQFCQTTLAMHPVEAVAEYRERGQHFVLYRLDPQWPTNRKMIP